MNTREIELGFDKDAAWAKAKGRLSVFLDTNCWIDMADEANEIACRIRDRLKALVSSGHVFCPLSWGILVELFKQSGESLRVTARLMENLSLNVIFVMRTELFKWELSRSIRRHCGDSGDESLNGLFAPPAAFVGSRMSLQFPKGNSITQEEQAKVQGYLKRELSKIGVVELVEKQAESRLSDRPPPAYSIAAKKAIEKFKGRKKQLFLAEAGNCFYTYITPLLLQYPPEVIASWPKQFGSATDDEEAWFLNALAELPAMHNYIEIMIVADSHPTRRDDVKHFLDNEIMVAPLAYANVFVSRDKGIKDILRNRTGILSRSSCQYCDSLELFETWLTERAA